ncbi:HNH endonuclease signature motif containing protein [Arthrobacter sp. MMS24-T111]
MGKVAVVEALADIRAALAVLVAEVDGCGAEPFCAADPLAGLVDGCLDVLAGAREVEARVAGLKARAAVAFADAAGVVAGRGVPVVAQEMAVAAEVGCVLALGPRAASSFLATAHAVVASLPLTLAGLQAGTLSWGHAVVMADEAAALDAAGAVELEAHFLDPDAPDTARGCPVGELPAHRFRAKARSWRERHHAESIETRHTRSVADRRVDYRPDRDGMAWLSAYLPADQAAAAWNRLNAISRGLQGPEETRTLAQLRADVFATSLLTAGLSTGQAVGRVDVGPDEGCTSPENFARPADVPPDAVRAQVLVTVPVFSLLGLTDEAAVLDGYGPIPASMARRLVAAGAGSFYRVLVDPRDGAPLEIGRKSYRVGKAMRNWLRLRDGKCPFPGCSNSSLDTEADHILAWANGGTTGISNLGQPCPKHHRLRHTTGWKPTPASKTDPPGWTSPAGRHYHSEHQDWEPTKWPPPDHRLKERGSHAGEPPASHPDFAYLGLSPGEESLARILHAPA